MSKSKDKAFHLFKQNSELEVLISAAIVFTAFAINDVTGDWIIRAINLNISTSSPVLFIGAIAGLYMSAMLPISIVSHFILRIYWLALVGLRSVFPEKKLEAVNPKFDRIINSSLNLDKRIEAIDKVCSSIFAFTFLTLFAFCFSFISMTVLILLLDGIDDPYGIAGLLANVFLLLGVIYMVDFLTLGWFKRINKKWFARIYYPVYRFFGWITLAFLYRGIYYSLIQHASRRVMLLITPVYILISLFFLNRGYTANSLYPDMNRGSLKGEVASNWFYKDQFPERLILRYPFLDSFIVPEHTNYMQVYFPLNADVEDNILEVCDSVEAFNKRGIHWRKWVQIDLNRLKYDSTFNYQKNAENILACVASNAHFMIDDELVQEELKFYFTRINEPEHAAVFTILDVEGVERGNHLLKIVSSENFGDRTLSIPFWRD